ncbi:MAG: hypothetical protein R6U51_01695 [Anaerolineales bacterium]
MTKTISVKLDIPQERQDDVLETFRQFNQPFRELDSTQTQIFYLKFMF